VPRLLCLEDSPRRSQVQRIEAVPAALDRTPACPRVTMLAITSPLRFCAPPSPRLELCTALSFVPACATAPTNAQPHPLQSQNDRLSGPSACHERLSHCVGTHSTPFMSLASRSLLGSGCSCRLKIPGEGTHGVLAPPALFMSDSRPQTPVFLFAYTGTCWWSYQYEN